jgi:hypothetical protein
MTPNVVLTVVITGNFNILWLLLYTLVIRRGFIDKTFGIPLIALWANFAWDIFGSIGGATIPMPQPVINGMYALIDLVILYQILRYWRNDFTNLSPRQFYFFFAFTGLFSFVLMEAFIRETNDVAIWRVAFIDTFINSALFIAMFYRRPGLEGQSLYIGLCKVFGTGPFMLLLYFLPQMDVSHLVEAPTSPLLVPLWIGIFILDVAYVVLVYQRSKELGINPWRRF